jgi:hypothetical protein
MFSGVPRIAVGEYLRRLDLKANLEAESYPTQDFVLAYKSDSLAARERIEQGDHTYE